MYNRHNEALLYKQEELFYWDLKTKLSETKEITIGFMMPVALGLRTTPIPVKGVVSSIGRSLHSNSPFALFSYLEHDEEFISTRQMTGTSYEAIEEYLNHDIADEKIYEGLGLLSRGIVEMEAYEFSLRFLQNALYAYQYCRIR